MFYGILVAKPIKDRHRKEVNAEWLILKNESTVKAKSHHTASEYIRVWRVTADE